MAAKGQPIIVIKKVSGHGGHHGGAWKVAYADFVTALMSLFIVLWLMSSSAQVRQAVAGYFNDPKGVATLLGTTLTGTGKSETEATNSDRLQKFKEKIEQEIKARKDLNQLSKQIEITTTPEGVRIELIEGKDGTFYELGSAKLSPSGQELLGMLAKELKTLPNSLLIEGYTDAAEYSNDVNYGNWELSADRANSARRLMQENGVRPDQVTQVRGYGDMNLRVPANPYDASNRRIDILVKNDKGQGATLSAANIVNGSTPLSEAVKTAAPAAKKGQPQEAQPAAQPPSRPVARAAAPANPPTGATAMVDKLKGMMPWKKK
jgi:chemotaxis protein MotB